MLLFALRKFDCRSSVSNQIFTLLSIKACHFFDFCMFCRYIFILIIRYFSCQSQVRVPDSDVPHELDILYLFHVFISSLRKIYKGAWMTK